MWLEGVELEEMLRAATAEYVGLAGLDVEQGLQDAWVVADVVGGF